MRLHFPRLLVVSLIPLLALAATIALGVTPWGEVYRTLVSQGAVERVAQVRLEGFEKPEVRFEVAQKERGAYVAVGLEEVWKVGEVGEVRLSVPRDWKLQEVRGVHASRVRVGVRDGNGNGDGDGDGDGAGGGMRELTFPHAPSVSFTFTANEPFDAIAFSHDSAMPALVTVAGVALPGRQTQKIVQIVESAWVFPLP